MFAYFLRLARLRTGYMLRGGAARKCVENI